MHLHGSGAKDINRLKFTWLQRTITFLEISKFLKINE
jgi:hypothetical protein